MNQSYCMVLCTCPDSATAESIARRLVESRLVACINIVPHLTSIYFWQGAVKEGTEVLMMMKTSQAQLEAVEAAVLSMHPYEFPEFIAFPIIYGNANYLKWVDDVTQSLAP